MRARPTQGLVVSGNSLIRRSTGHALRSAPAQSFKRSELFLFVWFAAQPPDGHCR